MVARHFKDGTNWLVCKLGHTWVRNNCIRIDSLAPSLHAWPIRGPSNGDLRAALDPLDGIACSGADQVEAECLDEEDEEGQHAFNDLNQDPTLADLGSEFADAYTEELDGFRQRERVRRARSQVSKPIFFPNQLNWLHDFGPTGGAIWLGVGVPVRIYFLCNTVCFLTT